MRPAGRRPLLKSVGRRSAPAGTAPAVMSRSSIPVKPRAKIKASAPACASFQGSYWKELVRGPGGDVRSQKNRIAGKFRATIEGLAANWQSQKKNRNDKCPRGWQDTNSQDTPARWRPFGPAYPQDEPGRGTCDGAILSEQILSAERNLISGWNTNQNVSSGLSPALSTALPDGCAVFHGALHPRQRSMHPKPIRIPRSGQQA